MIIRELPNAFTGVNNPLVTAEARALSLRFCHKLLLLAATMYTQADALARLGSVTQLYHQKIAGADVDKADLVPYREWALNAHRRMTRLGNHDDTISVDMFLNRYRAIKEVALVVHACEGSPQWINAMYAQLHVAHHNPELVGRGNSTFRAAAEHKVWAIENERLLMELREEMPH